jgi:flagellar protein FlbD
MIAITRLDGTPAIVNSDQIAWIEFNPDTVIALTNGEKLIVREPPDVIVDRVKAFRRAIFERVHATEGRLLTLAEERKGDSW